MFKPRVSSRIRLNEFENAELWALLQDSDHQSLARKAIGSRLTSRNINLA
ncbi:MAG TPA: hypothetical protein VMV52_02465 [Candidatus Nanopelagicaceae bacterium]|nr:hypothetical protein [Candidatus Nanopelagicaceae bacterium]